MANSRVVLIRSIPMLALTFFFVMLSVVPSVFATEEVKLELTNFWIRAMPPTQKITAGYGTITNKGTSTITLLGGFADFAESVVIHKTVHDDDSVHMMEMGPITLQPSESVEMIPGGTHIMLMEIANMPIFGSSRNICIKTDGAEPICTNAPVLRGIPSS